MNFQTKQGTVEQDPQAIAQNGQNQNLNSAIVGAQGIYLENYEMGNKPTETTNYAKYFQPLQGNFDQQNMVQTYRNQATGNANLNTAYISGNSFGHNSNNIGINAVYGVHNDNNSYQNTNELSQFSTHNRFQSSYNNFSNNNNNTNNNNSNSNNNIVNNNHNTSTNIGISHINDGNTTQKIIEDQVFDIRYNSVGTLASNSNMSSLMAATETSSVSHTAFNNAAATKNYLPNNSKHFTYFDSENNMNFYSKGVGNAGRQVFGHSSKNSGSYVSPADDITPKSGMTQYPSYQTPVTDYSHNNPFTSTNTEENLATLKDKLQKKDAQIETLEIEVQKLKDILNAGIEFATERQPLTDQDDHITVKEIEVSNSLDIIFRKLSTALQNREKELEEANNNLECILTALAMNPSNSSTKFGRYDTEELAHKTVVRLETLTKENQEMAKLLSFGRAKEKQIALEILKKENKELKDQIKRLNEKLPKEKV
ncbi:Protein MUM2 [Nakaseomyces bracarensis]|uniref:Protein MUM2 n=1 Tax=Nakaseomyces bracarensis TaxID=273131 RepID=A0ABR4NMB6_9SACH